MRLSRFVLGLIAVGLISGPARAELVTFTARGFVEAVFDDGTADVMVGDPFTVTYVFETTTPDTYPEDATVGAYRDAVQWVRVELGGVVVEFVPAPGKAWIDVSNDFESAYFGGYDEYVVEASDGMDHRVWIDLLSSDTEFLKSDALASVPPQLPLPEDMIWNGVAIRWDGYGKSVLGAVTSLELAHAGPPTMEDLMAAVLECVGDDFLANSLLAKLETVLRTMETHATEKGKSPSLLNRMEAFMHQVEAQRGKKIAAEDAAYLIDLALEILVDQFVP